MDSPTQPAARPPLSLRELFCLMTFAALTVGLVRYHGWDNHERWLLGLTLGGTFATLLVFRALRRRAWLASILMGSIGGLVALILLLRERREGLDRLINAGAGPEHISRIEWHLLAVAGGTVVLIVLLAGIAWALFHLAVWAISSGERGPLSTFCRHPWWTATVVAVIGALGLAVANPELLLTPNSWPASYRLQSEPEFIDLGILGRGQISHRTCSLSIRGDWLLVESHWPVLGGDTPVNEKLYRMNPHPREVSFADHPETVSSVAFDCDANRIAFVESPEEPKHIPTETHRIRVVDLDRQTSEIIHEFPRATEIHSLQWLPGGTLIVFRGHDPVAKLGHTRLDRIDGDWRAVESFGKTTFDTRANTRVEYEGNEVRVVDATTSEPITTFDPGFWLAMSRNRPFRIGELQISPDARFILGHNLIFDCEAEKPCEWMHEQLPWPELFTFTNQSLVVTYMLHTNEPPAPIAVLSEVPLLRHAIHWLRLEPVQLLDPATGNEVARTRRLPSRPTSVALSRDGSRMAVCTDQGVFVFDVPREFR